MTAKSSLLFVSRRAALAVAMIAAGVQLSAGEANAAFVVNGGFEDPGISGTFITLTGSSLPGWTIANGTSVDLIRTYWPPYEPNQSLDLNGNGPGKISQSFTTVKDATYTLSFAFSNNPDYLSFPLTPSPLAGLTVTGLGLLLSDNNIAHSTATFDDMDWEVYSRTFTADSTSTTLTFEGLNNSSFGIALDAVSVSAVPEFASVVTWSLLLGCVVGFKAWRRNVAA